MSLPIFISPDDKVKVKFFVTCKKSDPKFLCVAVEKDQFEMFYNDFDETKIEEHFAVFRVPTFEDQTRMTSDSIKINDDGFHADVSSFQMKRMLLLIDSWSLSPKPTVDEIRKLNNVIAMIINSQLDKLLS